jgi:hypothetical protein
MILLAFRIAAAFLRALCSQDFPVAFTDARE